MKYVALLSGGKDSCFNLLHCERNGHELIAAASMSPHHGLDEIDSYLYQTVGQDAIQFVAEALDVPLYRGIIKGTAVDQRSEYGSREPGKFNGVEGDETEDLFDLLNTVKNHHPDVAGVSVGAILSSYQRVRVEHVCQRLSLTPLCYLWQRDQDELLSEMIDHGLEAIIIKVAGIGLTQKHLGKTLAEMQPTLRRLNQQYGAHICGEGGEYETLTLDCPLFKRRIELQETETVIHSASDFAPVAYMRVKLARLVDKEPAPYEPITPPNILVEEFDDLHLRLSNGIKGVAVRTEGSEISRNVDLSKHDTVRPSSTQTGSWVSISNVQVDPDLFKDKSIEEETIACFQILHYCLQEHSISFPQITFMTVLISDMKVFPRINQVYKNYFGTNPPGRACVAVDLPSGINIKINCLAHSGNTSSREALHVQGLSYWAPANIGPYSQAVSVGDQIFISGQIGMQPSDLSMPTPSSFPLEAALSFQHASRITSLLKDMFGSTWAFATQLTLCWLASPSFVNVMRSIRSCSQITCAPFLMIGASALPKGALIETQIFAHTGRYISTDLGMDETHTCAPPKVSYGNYKSGSFSMYWQRSQFKEIEPFSLVLTGKGVSDEELAVKDILGESVLSGGIFMLNILHTQQGLESAKLFAQRIPDSKSVSFIPVRYISTEEDNWDFAVCLLKGS
ncbi:hypothetical protein SCHPADRAFT_920076 [Schizopora paradoxa]|uniref:Diphthine--ammonia ligase n=1 Tax=Schizopora paradoxa TaxID=27342 RepID=A0A0H2RW61_9AGAM|nr:hypothetical protein SCHPADRAFT_920076 [Schizopora paradoxa]